MHPSHAFCRMKAPLSTLPFSRPDHKHRNHTYSPSSAGLHLPVPSLSYLQYRKQRNHLSPCGNLSQRLLLPCQWTLWSYLPALPSLPDPVTHLSELYSIQSMCFLHRHQLFVLPTFQNGSQLYCLSQLQCRWLYPLCPQQVWPAKAESHCSYASACSLFRDMADMRGSVEKCKLVLPPTNMPPAIVEVCGQGPGLTPAHTRHGRPLSGEDTLGLPGAWGCGTAVKVWRKETGH